MRAENSARKIASVDCAHYGGNGLNANGRNTNRHWFEGIQPENRAVIDYFARLREAGVTVSFALDVHAGGTFRNHILMPMGPSAEVPVSEAVLTGQELWLEWLAGLRRRDGWALGLRRLAGQRLVLADLRLPVLLPGVEHLLVLRPTGASHQALRPARPDPSGAAPGRGSRRGPVG